MVEKTYTGDHKGKLIFSWKTSRKQLHLYLKSIGIETKFKNGEVKLIKK